MKQHFRTEVAEVDGAALVRIAGEVDMATVAAAQPLIDPLLAPDRDVVLDLSQVTFMDASGIKFLFRLQERLEQGAAHLVLCDPSERVRALLRLVEFTDAFTIEPRDTARTTVRAGGDPG